jgi:hypothetical protein
MTSIPRPASADPSATSTVSPLGQLAYRDDLEIARRRMKHLAPWHVEPMPMTQGAASAPAADQVEKPSNRNSSACADVDCRGSLECAHGLSPQVWVRRS